MSVVVNHYTVTFDGGRVPCGAVIRRRLASLTVRVSYLPMPLLRVWLLCAVRSRTGVSGLDVRWLR